jgi:DNA relaxase NicK
MGEMAASRPIDHSAPRLVIRGESIDTPLNTDESSVRKTSIIDHLSFTYRSTGKFNADSPLWIALLDVFNIPPDDWTGSKNGWNGYEKRIDLGRWGMVAFGGESQKNTVHVQINGQGCKKVQDWGRVCEWGVRSKCKITRLDIAHDDYEGHVVNIAAGLQWREQGLFDCNGRPPNSQLIDDFNSGKGKTLYIGSRKSGKLLRIYEKGKQLKDPLSPWCRVELELRNKGRKIEWDVILNSDSYLAGAYPALAFLSEQQCVLTTSKRENAIALTSAKKWFRTTAGQLLNLLCIMANEDLPAVVREMRRSGIPKKLQPCYEEFLRKSGRQQ